MIWILPFIFLFAGCATVIEGAKGVAGISTKALEEGRKKAIKKTFALDYDACYQKARDTVIAKQSYIYAQDKKKGMIALYVHKDTQKDTTAVGLFFQAIDATHTQVEVSSLSTYAKELIAGRVFRALEGKKDLKEEEEQDEK